MKCPACVVKSAIRQLWYANRIMANATVCFIIYASKRSRVPVVNAFDDPQFSIEFRT